MIVVFCVVAVICDLHWHVSRRNAGLINNGLKMVRGVLLSQFNPTERQSNSSFLNFFLMSVGAGV